MLKKICNILIAIILIILLFLAGALFGPKLFGYDMLAVVSGSMEPNIPVGSIVYVREVPFEDIEVGDVISFNVSQDTLVTHRVEEIDENKQEITTKGDANNTNDGEPISYSNVKGKVFFSIPFLGILSQAIKTPLGIAGACGVVFLMILLNYLPEIFEKEEKNN